MKYISIIIAGLLLCLSTATQAAVDIQRMLQETVKFTDASYSYSQNQREIRLQFSFPSGMANNNNFRIPFWIISSRTFNDIEDCKDYIVNDLAEDIDMRFIIYKNNEKDHPIAQINLNWNNVRRSWEHQVGGSTYNDPWYFSVPYTVSKEIVDSKAPLYGAIRIKDADGKQFYSGPVVIQYDSSCTKRCPPNQKLNIETCECECPPGYMMVKGVCKLIDVGLPGFDVLSKIPVNFPDGDNLQDYIYPLSLSSTVDSDVLALTLEGEFHFNRCRWIIDGVPISIKSKILSDFEKKTWIPFWKKLRDSLNILSNNNNGYFFILLQGSADGGTVCPTIDQASVDERMIYNKQLYYFRSTPNGDNIIAEGPYRYSNPVKNSDLPNLRSQFMRYALSIELKDFQGKGEQKESNNRIAVIDGLVVGGFNPRARNVRIYLLRTTSDPTSINSNQFQSVP